MPARREEAYLVDFVHKNVLTERADIINYVPTVGVFLYRTHVKTRLFSCRPQAAASAELHNDTIKPKQLST